MAQSTCVIQGCGRLMVIRDPGYCLMHYKRLRRRGTVHDVTTAERFFASVVQVDDCWVWRGAIQVGGYGTFGARKGRGKLAHRWSYEFLRVEIPEGLHLDHLCSNRACVNAWHLEPVTARVNVLRSDAIPAHNARKTHCIRDHEFTAANTYITPKGGRRQCRACMRIREARK